MEQLSSVWSGLDGRRRFIVVAATVGMFAAVIFLAQMASKPRMSLLYAGLDELDERSKDIIRSRWLQDDKMTLQELANRYGISAERIRQLEANALRKMRASITA